MKFKYQGGAAEGGNGGGEGELVRWVSERERRMSGLAGGGLAWT